MAERFHKTNRNPAPENSDLTQPEIAAIKTGIEQKREGGKDNCCRKSVMK